MGRLAKLKREIILESNKRLLGESKSYLTEQEKEEIRLPFIKLVTKYKTALQGIIENLNFENKQEEEEFCVNQKSYIEGVTKKLDDFIDRISIDMEKKYKKEVTPQQVLEALYDKANNGLIKTIINIAKPLVDAFGNEEGATMSKEILDGIEENMRTKYGKIGSGINSMLTEIMSKLNVEVEDICKNPS